MSIDMPRERTFWLLLGTLILAGFVVSWFSNRVRTEQLILAPEAPPLEPQKVTARVWREVRFEQISSIPTGQGTSLERPTFLRVDRQGNLFVLDSADRQIEKISAAGEPLATYGPADFQNPSDFAVAESGEVWVCDPNSKQITIFSPGGQIARVIRLDARPIRIILDARGGFLVLQDAGASGLFHRYSAEGRPLGSFGTFFPDALQNSLTADGWLLGIGSRASAHAFRHAGLLASYTQDGRLRFFRETIDPVPLPKITIDSAGSQRMDRKRRRSALSVSALGDEIYLLGTEGTKSTRVLDVYGAEDGSYRFSLASPDHGLHSLTMAPGRLYGARQHDLTIWRYSLLPPLRTPSAAAVHYHKEIR